MVVAVEFPGRSGISDDWVVSTDCLLLPGGCVVGAGNGKVGSANKETW